MSVSIEFHFDFGSPNAYLSHLVIPDIETRTGVKFEYVPVLLGGVFKITNNVSPTVSMNGIQNKPEYYELETQRFLSKHNISTYQRNPFFPVNTLTIMRGAAYCRAHGGFTNYVDSVFAHMWRNPKQMSEPQIIAAALRESGLPGEEILAGANTAVMKQSLLSATNDSVARGNFGSPTFFVGDEMFFGKDKLVDVEEAIWFRIQTEEGLTT
jgi:2-hydroxychromene-2-carboxylate isomerase